MKIIIFFIALFISTITVAQIKNTSDLDSIQKIEEIVITGQYSKQSVKKSVFDVTVINTKTIEQNAANNLADLLNQTLNISINPNTKSGKSGVSLFGFDSQYVKILIDNIPVINEEGIGNNIDLTLINLDDIEQIEIVEGSMGVQYGSNAVAGIINIITKKKSTSKIKIKTAIQEETVGNEYEWFNKGKHIQSLKVDYNINKNLYSSLAYSRNDFAGFWNGRKGEIYDKEDLRGHDWLPKENNNIKLLLNYKKNKLSAFYKFDYLNETIQRYNQIVELNHIAATDTDNPTALDRIYTNRRFIHNLSFNGVFNTNKKYDLYLSYQSQTKKLNSYTYYIRSNEKDNEQNNEYKSRTVFTTKGTLNNIISTKKFNQQIGFDIVLEKGLGTELSLIEGDIETQKLHTYDFFTSAEYVFNPKFSVRPGARISLSNTFDTQFTYSLSSKYIFDKNVELRFIAGSANRTPNYTELFERFLHPSHDVFGNENLSSEKGYSLFTHLKKKTWLNDNTKLTNKLSIGYIDLKDKITLLLVSNNPRDTYSYVNINKYNTLNFSLNNSLSINDFKINLGFTYSGIKQYLNSANANNEKYLFTPNLNTSIFYNYRKINTAFSLTYKYNGKIESYVFSKFDNDGNEVYSKGTTNAFGWLDATVKKSFFNKKIETNLGVRNILNVTKIASTAFIGGGHEAQPIAIDMAYGRSYFIKLTYNFKHK